jgi:hypothetical protein
LRVGGLALLVCRLEGFDDSDVIRYKDFCPAFSTEGLEMFLSPCIFCPTPLNIFETGSYYVAKVCLELAL